MDEDKATYSAEEVAALLKDASEKAFKAGNTKSERPYERELEKLRKELHQERTRPKIKEAYIKAGGIDANFNDYLLKHEGDYDEADEKAFLRIARKSAAATAWAFGSDNIDNYDEGERPFASGAKAPEAGSKGSTIV